MSENVKVTPRELFAGRVEEQMVGIPVPPRMHVTPGPDRRRYARTGVPCATPAPETDYVTQSPVMEYIAPAPPVTNSSPSQQLPPAYTSFLERFTEQVVDAPFPQGVKVVIRATVNELTAASAADELAPDIELDEARLRRVFDAALAERAAQELLADEVATKPTGCPATKKANKGRHSYSPSPPTGPITVTVLVVPEIFKMYSLCMRW